MKSNRILTLILTGLLGWNCQSWAGVFHAGTAQDLQTALSLAASNGEDDTI